MANVMASAAQWERRIIGQRTKDALAEKRAEGVTLGRPAVLPEALVERIVAARSAGDGWSAIARALNIDEVPTAHGGAQWHPSTVRAIVLGRGAQWAPCKYVYRPKASCVESALESPDHFYFGLVTLGTGRRQERGQSIDFRVHPTVVPADQAHHFARTEPEDVEIQTSAWLEDGVVDLFEVNGVAVHSVDEVLDLHHVAGEIEDWVVGDTVPYRPQEHACLGCVKYGCRQLDGLEGDVLVYVAIPPRASESETRQVLDLGLPTEGLIPSSIRVPSVHMALLVGTEMDGINWSGS